MKIAITGATGFLGRYIVDALTQSGHECRCWQRDHSDTTGFGDIGSQLSWVSGELGSLEAEKKLVQDCDVVVHGALARPGDGFRGGEGDFRGFVETNLLGTLSLIESSRQAGVKRFIFISSCAVHDKILDDRKLDEAHPLWALSHYGAYKAAVEKFIHSYGFGQGYAICSLRPTGIYGTARPVQHSKWFELAKNISESRIVECSAGGKEVHAFDVARAVRVLLDAKGIAGESYNCYDMYISEYDVAMIAKNISGSQSKILGKPKSPKHQIDTQKLKSLGMTFGGKALLEKTVASLLDSVSE